MSGLPKGWTVTLLEGVVDILDSQRIPLNSAERRARIAGKAESDLVSYYGATGRVGFIDSHIFNEELVLLGEDGAPSVSYTHLDVYKRQEEGAGVHRHPGR